MLKEKKRRKKKSLVRNKFVLSTQVIGGHLYFKRNKVYCYWFKYSLSWDFPAYSLEFQITILGHFHFKLQSGNYKSLYALQTYSFLQATRYSYMLTQEQNTCAQVSKYPWPFGSVSVFSVKKRQTFNRFFRISYLKPQK